VFAFPRPLQHEADEPKTEKANEEDAKTSRVVPGMNSVRAMSRTEPNQNRGAAKIAEKGQDAAGENQKRRRPIVNEYSSPRKIAIINVACKDRRHCTLLRFRSDRNRLL